MCLKKRPTGIDQSGFTIIEIALVLLIVSILLGYTVALFPRQQELKQYRALDQEMDRVIAAILGFAQVNGRLPCPSFPNSLGSEVGGGAANCTQYGGFVPINTLGITGRTNDDSLLLDPWGNPYRYYVSDSNVDVDPSDDFVVNGEMRDVGLISTANAGYLDLDGQFIICDQGDATLNDICDAPAVEIFGNALAAGGPYAGAPFVLVSHGQNWRQGAAGDELVNMGATLTTALVPPIPNGPENRAYLLKDVLAGETTFVRRTTGLADDFDDVVKWVSPNVLFSKMIEADQLP